MRQSKAAGVIVGLFFCVGVAAVFVLTLRVSNIQQYQGSGGYAITAKFENIGGLRPGAAVKMGGVLIGRVTDISLDESFSAKVSMVIDNKFNNLPEDSNASILTAGLLGEQYIGMSPGGMPDVLEEGSEVEFTQSALVLERLIGQLVFSITGGDKDKEEE